MENYNHFVTIVAGENPEALIENYKYKDNEVPHVKYWYKDANKLKNLYIEQAKYDLENTDDELLKEELKEIIPILESQTDDEFWDDLGAGMDIDENNNILSYDDEDAKFASYNLGKYLSVPFILKDGSESFQSRKGDIDWDETHLRDYNIYIRTWELAVEDASPLNEVEKNIKKQMGNMKGYFDFFGDKETYAFHSSAFWGYAFLNEDGWVDLSTEQSQIEWVANFYEHFIEPLSDNTLLTIFECRK